jgi:hypothetical protein
MVAILMVVAITPVEVRLITDTAKTSDIVLNRLFILLFTFY